MNAKIKRLRIKDNGIPTDVPSRSPRFVEFCGDAEVILVGGVDGAMVAFVIDLDGVGKGKLAVISDKIGTMFSSRPSSNWHWETEKLECS